MPVAGNLLLVEQVLAEETARGVGEDDTPSVPELVSLASGVAGQINEWPRTARAELGQLEPQGGRDRHGARTLRRAFTEPATSCSATRKNQDRREPP
jgi:hypothetical protein